MGVLMERNTNRDTNRLMISVLFAFLLTSFFAFSFSAINVSARPASALEDLNSDGKLNAIDRIMSLNWNILSGDTNNDARVDMLDLEAIVMSFGSEPGDPNWNPGADVANTVDKIDIFDLATAGRNFNIHNEEMPLEDLDPPVSVVPANQTVAPGDSFSIDIDISTPVGIYAYDILLSFDPSIINATAAADGGFLGSDGASTFPVVEINNSAGEVRIGCTRFGTSTDVKGNGTLTTMTFTALATGHSGLMLEEVTLVNSLLQVIPLVTAYNGTAYVHSGCASHDYFLCVGDDVYWFDSCGLQENMKEDCSDDYCDEWGESYCSEGNVYRNRTCHDKGCLLETCYDAQFTDEEIVEECAYGCLAGTCNHIATINLPAGVSLFSLPLVPVGGSVAFNGMVDSSCNLVVNTANTACMGPYIAYMNPETECYECLETSDPLFPGQGYFIKVSGPCSFTVTGTELQASQAGYLGTGIIRQGETVIGAPSQPVSFASIKGSCAIAEDPLRLYTGVTSCDGVPDFSGASHCYSEPSSYDYCYCSVDTLRPGFGYKIQSDNECGFV